MLHAPDVTDGETCGFFRNRRKERLFYHRSAMLENRPLVVFCNPLLEEHIACQPYVTRWLRYLADHHFNVLAFDYAGSGNSWGQHPVTTDLMIEDVMDTIEWYRNVNPISTIFLIGIRFGLNIALLAAGRVGAARLIGVDPILDVEQYWTKLLRTNLLNQLYVHGRVLEDRKALSEKLRQGERINISGYDIDMEFADSIRRFDMTAVQQPLKENCCLFLHSGSEEKNAQNLGFRHTTITSEPSCNDTRYYVPNSSGMFREAMRFLNE